MAPWTFLWNGVEGRQIVARAAYSYWGACAPAWFALGVFIYTPDEEGTIPAPFDQDRWIGYCLPFWREDLDSFYLGCAGELLDGTDLHTLGEGLGSRVAYLRPSGTEGRPWWDRTVWTSGIRFEIGPVSSLADLGGWGLPPLELRPDGSDPSNPDDTFARDYVAAVVLKTSTRRNGVIVSFDNHDRCRDGAWAGPDERGRWRCTDMGPPTAGWSDGGAQYWTEPGSGMVFSIPMMTLASTGLPDPDVPGGVVIHVASSPAYERFEGWAYPHAFEPDLVPFDDVPEAAEQPGSGSLVGQTYRFGKDPQWDVRMVMGSNWHRFHRPLDGEEDRP
jgi:hypothetical protein